MNELSEDDLKVPMSTTQEWQLKRTALVLYGSETGTAQDGAEEIGRMLTRLHFVAQVHELNDIEPSKLMNCALVICTISTTGQGDIPPNAKMFWKKILRAKLPPTLLAPVRFAVFGFGDSSYPKYNFAGLKLHKRFIQLGASAIIPMGRGDEQHPEGHESTFLPWMIDLRDQILAIFPLPLGQDVIPEDVVLQPTWLLTTKRREVEANRVVSSMDALFPLAAQRGSNNAIAQDFLVKVHGNARVTPADHWQDVRHLELLSDLSTRYDPGDILTVYPHNPKEHVQEVIDLMEWSEVADENVYFTHNGSAPIGMDIKFPSFHSSAVSLATTLRDLLTQHLDINSIPRRSFFSIIAHFTQDEFQKNRLQEFSNTEYLDELYDYTTRPRRSILEVLQEFDTVKIPWQWAAAVFPVLRGRQFSIASGGKLLVGPKGTTRFELLVAIVKYKTVIRKIRRGVCSRYIEGLAVGDQISVTLQKGGLGIREQDLARPFILVGPGTGIAPIRSLLWQKLAWSLQSPSNNLDRSVLFFGCRNQKADYFFENEWKLLQSLMPLDVHPAFSRDQDQKQYVQDVIKKHSKKVFDIAFSKQGMIFICGSSGKMPLAVRAAIKSTLVDESSMSEEEAETHLILMEKNNLYKQETW